MFCFDDANIGLDVKVAWQESKLMSVIAFVFPLGYIMSACWQFMNL